MAIENQAMNYFSKYINDGKINEAENLIFEHINGCRSAINFEIALSFYRKLSQWSDEQLSKVNFSREEIIEGLTEVKSIYESIDIDAIKNGTK
jgi:hypothetical protein